MEYEDVIRARAAAATPGPWYGEASEIFGEEAGPFLSWTPQGSPWGRSYDQERIDADAAFIAHAREDVPWLLERLDTERAARQAAETERDRLRAIARAAAIYVEAIQGVAEAATDAELYRRITGRAQGYMALREALAAAGILVYAENNTFTLAEEGAEDGTTP